MPKVRCDLDTSILLVETVTVYSHDGECLPGGTMDATFCASRLTSLPTKVCNYAHSARLFHIFTNLLHSHEHPLHSTGRKSAKRYMGARLDKMLASAQIMSRRATTRNHFLRSLSFIRDDFRTALIYLITHKEDGLPGTDG